MTDDIVTRLRIPLPYNLQGMTTTQLGAERREAADEIERLRAMLVAALENNDYWRDAVHRATCPVCKGDLDE